MKQRIALILTGGGARAAYQVGVLKAISEMLPRRARNPFPIICGTSAGALNAATLAVNARSFRKGVQYLLDIWKNFHANQVYRTDAAGVFNNTILWIAGVFSSAVGISKLKQVSLLDNSPLVELLDELLPCEKIQESIDSDYLYALSITASGYGSGESVTFYQGSQAIEPWHRTGRVGIPTQIEIKHLLASSALPFIFPATLINREYFGDGSMRQIAPIGTALNLGATRVLVIGVTSNSYSDHVEREDIADYPSLAKIAGHALNSIFLDSMEVDLERVRKINSLVAMMTEEMRQRSNLKHVDVLVISPSQPIEKIAAQHADELPWTIRLLLRLVGARQHSSSTLVSYLLSEKKFCRSLINLGYQDTINRREEIMHFLELHGHGDLPQ
ncbi:MAG: patatin-like phospholipase family protein [Gallionella sp.]|nr:patatin-like phospholipase family protein [Gallionella sp.]